MRRRAGTLVPFEIEICVCAADLRRQGVLHFHGYALARALQRDGARRSLSAYGALYRALSRLEERGFVTSRWEDPEVAQRDRRPTRRLYELTATGEQVAREAAPAPSPAPRMRRKAVPA